MKTKQLTRLRRIGDKTIQCYEVELCELAMLKNARFVVNFRYGTLGKTLREGTKTPEPTTHERAIKLFNSVVVAKQNAGYVDDAMADTAPDTATQTATAPSTDSPDNVSPSTDKDQGKDKAKQTILRYLDTPPGHWKLSRIVWRAGELAITEASDKILTIAENPKRYADNSPFILRYACLWALVRCGNAQQVARIQSLLDKEKRASLKHLGEAVCLLLADQSQKTALAQSYLQRLPDALADAIQANDFPALRQHLSPYCEAKSPRRYAPPRLSDAHVETLLSVYHLGAVYPVCRQAIRGLFTDGVLSEAHFQLSKQLFKFALLHADGALLAQCILHIETLPPDWQHDYSQATLNYYRRRSWRALKRLGEAGDSGYLDLAQAILLSVKDADASAPKTLKNYRYDWDSYENVLVSTRTFGRFPKLLAFNAIVYEHSQRFKRVPNRLAWFIDQAIDHDTAEATANEARTEAFPTLWDNAPERLLDLLRHAENQETHTFASRALRDNVAFCARLVDTQLDALCDLLTSHYDCTAQFALAHIQTAFANADNDDNADNLTQKARLINACLPAAYPPAQQQALAWLQANPACLTADFSLFATAVCYCQHRPELQACVDAVALNAGEQQQLIDALIAHLNTQPAISETAIAALMETLKPLTPDALPMQTLARIDALLSTSDAPDAPIALFGALLLVENRIAIDAIPDELLLKIHHSDSEAVQAVAVSLLNKHSDSELLDKYSVLRDFALSEKSRLHLAVRPIIARLSQHRDFANRLLNDLVPAVFRAESVEGFHANLLALAETTLHEVLPDMDSQLRWRLLHAQSKAAKKLGAMAMDDVPGDTYSVKQWALLGGNETLSVREWAWRAYEQHVETIKAQANDALRLLNSSWADSRDFAIDYFRAHFDTQDWTPTRIIHLCDNTDDTVQRFGRELLTQHFDAGDGVTYLIHLSQHPSHNVQLFTTNFLAEYAGDSPARLQTLKPYFITVLSQVYKGRVAKDRVIAFLNRESLKSQSVAELVADIYTRQSVTLAIKDKAQYIEGMHALHRTFPDIALPMRVKPLAIKRRHTAQRGQYAV